jgi:hypothetical protein
MPSVGSREERKEKDSGKKMATPATIILNFAPPRPNLVIPEKDNSEKQAEERNDSGST